jgi:hypothetical protein
MRIRALKPTDLYLLRKIHEEFYAHEFEFPDFSLGFLCCFVVEDDDGNVVSAGGLRPIAESIIITDKRQSIKKRREALYDILSASAFVAEKDKFNQIHAFVQEEGWTNHLLKVGFEPTKGRALVLNI